MKQVFWMNQLTLEEILDSVANNGLTFFKAERFAQKTCWDGKYGKTPCADVYTAQYANIFGNRYLIQ